MAKTKNKSVAGTINVFGESLPEALELYRGELLKLVQKADDMIEWPEGAKFLGAEEPARIGDILIRALRPDMQVFKYGYLFRERITKTGATVFAKAFKVGGKLKYYSELDFIIEINWTAYRGLAPYSRVALIDHELTHCTMVDGNAALRVHDIEEFGSIVKRWGDWLPHIKAFVDQYELFGK